MGWLHAVVDVPRGAHDPAARFWGRALGWRLGDPWHGHPELRSFEAPLGDPYVHLQLIDGPPRVHLDLEVEDPERTAASAAALGAVLAGRSDRWQTLLSPGGLPFCVLASSEHVAPGPVAWPDGHRSRLVQVCLDSPSDRQADEVRFWRALLEGRWAESPAEEFAGKWHDDDGSPVQLLFQRLRDGGGPVRAHLDLGTDDLAAEVRRLIDVGAADVGPGRSGWHVLRDPSGMPFCVTENPPDQTRRRDID